MYRIVGLIAAVGLLAGCGATNWNSAEGSAAHGKTVTSPQAARAAAAATAAETAAERPYVDALVVSAQAQSKDSPAATPKNIRCVATALVHGFGAAAFTKAGLTPTMLRDPNITLETLPVPSDDGINSTGAAIQRCHLGTLMGLALGDGMHLTDTRSLACLSQHFDTDSGARRFVVLAWMGRPPDLLSTHLLVGLIAACIDLPAYVLDSANVQVDATTRACILDTLKSSESQLKDLMALLMAGLKPSAEQYQETLAVSINQCRPSARTGFTVPAG